MINQDGTVVCEPDSIGAGGGVSQIVAGSNITISPAGGTGVVTINSSGGGGGVDGSGNANYVSKWTDSDTLGNSLIYDNGTNIGIGITSPGLKLHVSGNEGAPATSGTTQNGHARLGSGDLVLDMGTLTSPAWGAWLQTTNKTNLSLEYNLLLNPNGGNVGIGTTNPGAKLEVAGQVKITSGSPGLGKVLTSDATGLASWQTPSSGIGGSGTANYIPKFTGASAIGNSVIYDDNGRVVIGGVTAGVNKLFVNGETDSSRGMYVSGQDYGIYAYNKRTVAGEGSQAIFAQNASSLSGTHCAVVATTGPVCSYAAGLRTGVTGCGADYDFYAGGQGTNYGASSSIRWKRNIKPIDDAVGKVNSLRGVYFDWDKEHGGEHDIGMIAEEVGEVLPEIVEYDSVNPEYTTGMDYSKLTPLLLEAIKQQQKEIEFLRQEVEELRTHTKDK